QHPERAHVLLTAKAVLGNASTECIGLSAVGKGRVLKLAVCGNESDTQRADIHHLANTGRDVMMALTGRLPPCIAGCRRIGARLGWRVRGQKLAIGAVVDKRVDGKLRQQGIEAAYVVEMVVGHEQIIEMGDAKLGCSLGNSVGADGARGL